MNFLCICQYGHSRSVALTRVLHGLRQNAVAIGWATSGAAILPLAEWATHICLVDGHAMHHVPQDQRHKAVDFNIGPDRWSNPYNQELLAILRKRLEHHFPDVLDPAWHHTEAERRESVRQSIEFTRKPEHPETD